MRYVLTYRDFRSRPSAGQPHPAPQAGAKVDGAPGFEEVYMQSETKYKKHSSNSPPFGLSSPIQGRLRSLNTNMYIDPLVKKLMLLSIFQGSSAASYLST